MLPIDTLNEKAEALLTREGYDLSAVYAVVRLDKALAGDIRDTFLALLESEVLLRIDPEKDTVEEFSLAKYTQPYIDSFLSACRLLARFTPEGQKPCTVPIGDASNTCKSRLFVFLAVWEAMARGDRMDGTETLFDGIRPRPEPQGSTKKFVVLRRMFSLFGPHRATVALILILLFLEIGVDMLSPYLSGTILFDSIIDKGGRWHNYTALAICLSGIVGLSLVRFVSRAVRNVKVSRTMNSITHTMRTQIFGKMQRMSMSYYNNNNMGQHYRLIGGDVGEVRVFFGDTIGSLVIYVVEFVSVLVMLFLLNWKLSIGILIPVPILFLIYRRAFPMMRRLNIRAARESSAVETRITDSLNGIRVVKAFSKEKEESGKLAERLDRLYRVNLKANMLSVILSPTIAFLFYVARQTIWGGGGIMVMGDEMSYGDFCTYLGYIGMVFAPLQFFSDFINKVGHTAESASRIVGILEAVPEVQEKEVSVFREELAGEIVFSDVSFHYTPNRPILRGLTFRIEAGEHIGLVGKTGSGKSTMANLLLRMYDVKGGTITIDGVDVRDYSFETLRRRIAIVSQEVHIFNASVADNIRFGRPDAPMDEVIAAARAAGAHEFISALPEGYDTRVGGWGGGIGLSGGERQRLSIARAIVTRPSILILDEATAAMDNETEQRIAAAIAELVKGRTTISIAHRLSTLRDCDKIMAIEGGTLAEMGTRAELLAKEDGIFKKLYTLQTDQMNKVLKGDTEDGSAQNAGT